MKRKALLITIVVAAVLYGCLSNKKPTVKDPANVTQQEKEDLFEYDRKENQ